MKLLIDRGVDIDLKMDKKCGKLIVIDGLDGCGKATQAQILCENLKLLNFNVRKISFPDYQNDSSALVKMYLNSQLGTSPDKINAYASSSFFAVDRFASYEKFWKDFYLSGGLIVADRYTTSNAIYHMGKLPKNIWDDYLFWLEDFEYSKLELPEPDMVIYLDMPVEVSQNLIQKRYGGDLEKKDLHEKDINFLYTCKNCAEYALEKLKWKRISCIKNNSVKDVKEVSCEILDLVKHLLQV